MVGLLILCFWSSLVNWYGAQKTDSFPGGLWDPSFPSNKHQPIWWWNCTILKNQSSSKGCQMMNDKHHETLQLYIYISQYTKIWWDIYNCNISLYSPNSISESRSPDERPWRLKSPNHRWVKPPIVHPRLWSVFKYILIFLYILYILDNAWWTCSTCNNHWKHMDDHGTTIYQTAVGASPKTMTDIRNPFTTFVWYAQPWWAPGSNIPMVSLTHLAIHWSWNMFRCSMLTIKLCVQLYSIPLSQLLKYN